MRRSRRRADATRRPPTRCLVRQHPASGYSDNALWQAANLASLAYERFGTEADKKTAARLFTLLAKEYPTSKLVARATEALIGLDSTPASPPAPTAVARPVCRPPLSPCRGDDAGVTKRRAAPRGGRRPSAASTARYCRTASGSPSISTPKLAITRKRSPTRGGCSSTSRASRPRRACRTSSLKYDGDVVKEVRLGRHPQNTTRLVVDLEGVSGYSVYPLYGPYRLVMDFRRTLPSTPTVADQRRRAPDRRCRHPCRRARTSAPLATVPQVKQTDPETAPSAA